MGGGCLRRVLVHGGLTAGILIAKKDFGHLYALLHYFRLHVFGIRTSLQLKTCELPVADSMPS